MKKIDFIESLACAFKENSLEEYLNEESADKLYTFAQMLIETNKSFNLTAITDENEIILKHFLDCATVLKHIPLNASMIDIGCGAGFPSVPIAILRGDVNVTSLDSTAKKINFINNSAERLHLRNIQAICCRAEDHARSKRESYDVAISRAVARLNILDEICLPLINVGGRFIAMKSSRGNEEYSEASNGIKILGGELEEHSNFTLKHSDMIIERELFVFKKAKRSPMQYPRNYSQISKKPL